jgi:hypothetical protein
MWSRDGLEFGGTLRAIAQAVPEWWDWWAQFPFMAENHLGPRPPEPIMPGEPAPEDDAYFLGEPWPSTVPPLASTASAKPEGDEPRAGAMSGRDR